MSDKFEVDFDAFRFYKDGTETGAIPWSTQDTNLVDHDVSSDSQVQLRIRVQEIGAGSIAGATTDDYTLEYRLNGGGSWIAITTTSDRVKVDTGSGLTDDDPTTNRAGGITDGSGSFFAGVQEEGDAELTDFQHEADNFTEHVFALLLVSADFADADYVQFRLRLNGGAMDNSVTPQITVDKGATDYPVNVEPGTYSVTGDVDTAPLVGRAIDAAPDSYAISGITATLLRDAMIDVAPDTYAITGVDASLNFGYVIITDVGVYLVTGVDSTMLIERGLNASPGSYTISGVNASLLRDALLSVDPGGYALSGADATFTIEIVLDAAPGVYSIAGVNMTPLADRLLSVDAGLYYAGGVRQDLFDPSKGGFEADTGAWVPYGGNAIAVSTVKAHSGSQSLEITFVNDSRGAYIFLSDAADLIQNLVIGNTYKVVLWAAVNGGSSVDVAVKDGTTWFTAQTITSTTMVKVEYDFIALSTTGCAIGMAIGSMGAGEIIYIDDVSVREVFEPSLVSGRVLSADPDSYSIVGQSASLVAGYVVATDVGSYLVTGVDAALVIAHMLDAGVGIYSITGVDATLQGPTAVDYPLNMEPGVYALTGDLGTLLATRLVSAAPGVYAVLGNAATLEQVIPYLEELEIYYRSRPLRVTAAFPF